MSLDHTTLSAQLRDKTGKGVAHRLRANQLIPAVVYGPHSDKPLSIAVDPKALASAINTPHKLNTIVTLKLDGGGERMALLKTFQHDPVSRKILHADFYEVRMEEKVTVPVPVVLVGKAEGTTHGGILEQDRRELTVTCLPKDIPEKIEIDVSHLKIGQSIHVNEVKPPPGCALKFTTNFVMALVAIPEKEEVVAPVAAAPTAAGAAPAGAEAGKAGAAAPAKEGGKAAAAGAAPTKEAGAKAPAKK